MDHFARSARVWLKFVQFVLVLTWLFGLCVPVHADGAPRSLLPQEMRKTCREATNGCQVCVVGVVSGVVHCSLPGIACQPKSWSCRVPIKAGQDLKRNEQD